MILYSVIAIFCQHIREEMGGTDTLIGILPDNVQLPSFPVALPNLSVYARIHLSPSFTPDSISVSLVMPDEKALVVNELKPELILRAVSEANASGAPIAGLIVRVSIAQFVIVAPGRIRAIASINGQDHVCGALNFMLQTAQST